jgi:hypothetical protein
MHASDVFDIVAGILTIALAAVFLTKPDTANDVNAVGNQFTGALKQAEAG